MKKVLLVYLSKKGTTKYFAHNIGNYLKESDLEVSVISLHDLAPELLRDFDYILLGCWTHGLFVAFQHPEKQWIKFMKQIPEIKDKKVGLFTTYKLATGSMFRKMEKPIADKILEISLTLKAKGEELNDNHKALLKVFIESK